MKCFFFEEAMVPVLGSLVDMVGWLVIFLVGGAEKTGVLWFQTKVEIYTQARYTWKWK
jgi:hypothetical protein